MCYKQLVQPLSQLSIRPLAIALFLLLPQIGFPAVIQAPKLEVQYPANTPAPVLEHSSNKEGLFKRWFKKTLLKRIHKSLARASSSDGKWLSIGGIGIGIIGFLPYFLALELGLFFSIPLALLGAIGLGLSILGLEKAGGWRGNQLIRTLAIIGIVINSLLILGLLVLLILLSRFKQV